MTTSPDDRLRTESPPTSPPPDTRAAIRQLVMRLHFYAGVFVGPFILIAAVTGLLYALIPQIDDMVYRHELTVDHAGAHRLSLADQLTAARAAHPEGTVTSIRPPATPDETTQVQISVDDVPPDYARTVFVDPYTAEVRGALTTYGQWMPIRSWFDDLHRNLHLGAVGRNYSELAASWMWIIALAGLALWFLQRRDKPSRLLIPDRTATGRRKAMSWHAVLGVWVLAVLLALSVTGITWSRYGGETVSTLQATLNSTAPSVDATTHHGHPAGSTSLDGADTVLTAAEQAGLTGPMWMYPPAEPGAGWTVSERKRDWPTRNDSIAVDPHTGTVTDRVNFADWPLLAKLTRWTIDAHMGLLFGVVNQIVLALSMIGLIALITQGYRMWWHRRPTRGSRWALGRPPLRGAIRRLPSWGIATLVVTATVLGWCLPLFGLSLAAFLVIDTAIAYMKRKQNRNA